MMNTFKRTILFPFFTIAALLLANRAEAQFSVDCSCLSTQSVLVTNACQAVVPDLCQFTNCWGSTIVPPIPLTCSQTPTAGTPVGPGTWPITLTILDPNGTAQQCVLVFTVNPPAGGCGQPFTLLCATNKTVECDTNWNFDLPTWTNNCAPPPGTPSNGVVLTVLSITTNGTCPMVVTITWQGVDDCGNKSQCSQTVTVVDTTPPTLNCVCLTNNAALPPIPLLVTNCSDVIPDLCLYAQFCSSDNCGPLTCSQTPAAGTVVGPGTHPITVTVWDCASNSASCVVNFFVIPPLGGCSSNPCPTTLAMTINTGTTNGIGGLLPTGVQEQVWTNVAAPGGPAPMVVADTNLWPIFGGPWLPPSGVSAWVSPSVGMNGLAGWYTNRVTFNAPCTNVCLRGRIASDDDGYLYVNGAFVSGSGFTFWSNVNHCVNFVQGTNTIEFVVHNAGGPTGFRTELEIWTQCCCASQTNVWNTGMGGPNGNVPLGATTPDPNYLLVSAPPGGCTGPAQVVQPWSIPGVWVPNSTNSQWIGAGPTVNCQGGVYRYRLCFYLPCTEGASLVGQWTADDWAAMHLNGMPTGNTVPSTQFPNVSFGGWHPVNITNGFVCGTNCVDFYVTNAWTFPNPTGLRAQLTNIFNDCCAPCTPQPCACGITNGDFNLSVPDNGTGGGWTSSGGFGAPFSGWQASGGNPGGTFLLNNVGDPATDPTISQTLCCLVPGQCYTIRGQRKVQAWFGQTAPSFAVLVDGAPILTLPVPTNPATTNWHNFSASFTATNTCQTIGFAAEWNGTDVSYWIDNIRVECCNPGCAIRINCPRNLTLLTCTNGATGYYTVGASGNNGPVVCTPPSGSVFPMGTTVVICTATNTCGEVATCHFPVIVRRPPNWWDCIHAGIGIPFVPVGGASYAFRTTGESDTPTLSVIPDPGTPNSGIALRPGPAQSIRFTTLLDYPAPDGAGFDLHLPPDPLHPNDPPILSIRSKGPKGYCVKMNKGRAADPTEQMRAFAVNTNGDLLDSIPFTPAEVDAFGVCEIGFQPGVSNCHVTIEVNLVDGSSSIEFDGPVTPVTPTVLRHKGWDGCIYGLDRPRPKPPKTARIIMIPPALPPGPPITEAFLYVSGWPEMLIEEPSLSARGGGRKWSDGHVTLMKAYDDGTEQGVEFRAFAGGGGVQVDLGHTESFNLRLTKIETNLPPGEQLLTRTLGPIRGLTNRPPPPFLDAMLLQSTPDGVDCSADFSNIESPTLHVLIYNGGALVAERTGVPGGLGQTLFTLPEWPQTLGKLGGRTPCRVGTIRPGTIRLPGSGGGLPGASGGGPGDETVVGDEFRVIAEMPPGTPTPDYYSAFEFITTEGADWGISDLQRTLACTSDALHLERAGSGILITWLGEGFRLMGAETVTGPWFDLGVESPSWLPASHPARFFRLVCD